MRVYVKILLLFCFTLSASQAWSQDVKSYFMTKLDTLVAQFASNNFSLNADEERTDPAFYRMFVPTVLYEDAVKRGISKNDGNLWNKNTDSKIELCDRRNMVIDGLLLDVYRSHPHLVRMIEADIRREVTARDFQPEVNMSTIKIESGVPEILPGSLHEALETKKVKPNYWRTSGSFSFNFTQNYFSGNWAQGGENNRTLIAGLVLRLNYKDNKKISFENTFEAKLGFVTVSGDTLHGYRTNNDMMRIQSRFGYKILNNIDLTANMTLQSQFMPNYPTNSNDFVSNFMAPFDANFSLGFNYKRSGKNWNLSLFFAPLSSYNYKFVRYSRLASRYGIRNGRQHKEDFGTQIQPTFSATIFKNVSYSSRLEFYTNYARAYFNWENTFTMNINKYLKTTLFMHGRFDDSSRGLYSDSYGYWQFKEYMSLGLTYSW